MFEFTMHLSQFIKSASFNGRHFAVIAAASTETKRKSNTPLLTTGQTASSLYAITPRYGRDDDQNDESGQTARMFYDSVAGEVNYSKHENNGTSSVAFGSSKFEFSTREIIFRKYVFKQRNVNYCLVVALPQQWIKQYIINIIISSKTINLL